MIESAQWADSMKICYKKGSSSHLQLLFITGESEYDQKPDQISSHPPQKNTKKDIARRHIFQT